MFVVPQAQMMQPVMGRPAQQSIMQLPSPRSYAVQKKKYKNAQKRGQRYEATYTDSAKLEKVYVGMFDTAEEANEASNEHMRDVRGIKRKKPTSKYNCVFWNKQKKVWVGERTLKKKSSGSVSGKNEDLVALQLEIKCYLKGLPKNNDECHRVITEYLQTCAHRS